MTFQESETIELKEIVVEDIKKEIIAFANSAGGTLYDLTFTAVVSTTLSHTTQTR